MEAQCSLCKLSFSTIDQLSEHIESHKIRLPASQNECKFCSQIFENPEALKLHRKSHGRKIYSCELCLREFGKPEEYSVHLKIHENIRIWECRLCSVTMASEKAYLSHLGKIHDFGCSVSLVGQERNFKCHLCGLEFKRLGTLEMHLKRNHLAWDLRETPVELINIRNHVESKLIRAFQCKICSLKLAGLKTLQDHLKIHQKTKFQCKICQLEFSLEKTLESHLLKHQEPNYFCEVCQIPYRFERDLELHRRIHSKDGKPETCPFCDKKFSAACDLKKHVRCHTKEKVFVCTFDGCGKEFSHLTSFSKHKIMHSGVKQFVCYFCGNQFANKSNLAVHLR